MLLWISGFLAGDNEDDSLKYSLDVPPEFEQATIDILGWGSIEKSPDGEWLLTPDQVRRIGETLNEKLPEELDIFIGLHSG